MNQTRIYFNCYYAILTFHYLQVTSTPSPYVASVTEIIREFQSSAARIFGKDQETGSVRKYLSLFILILQLKTVRPVEKEFNPSILVCLWFLDDPNSLALRCCAPITFASL